MNTWQIAAVCVAVGAWTLYAVMRGVIAQSTRLQQDAKALDELASNTLEELRERPANRGSD